MRLQSRMVTSNTPDHPVTTHASKPPSLSLLEEVHPNEQQGLLRGIHLERSRPWHVTLRFALVVMPVLWLVFTVFFLFFGSRIFALLDALAWSLPISTVLTLAFYLFYPWFLGSPRLCLRNDILQLHGDTQPNWVLPLEEPFCFHLLYRIDREDALLILQPEKQSPLFLYGRYRNHRTMPRLAIPVTPMGFSLAELALDQLGAWMMPDRDIEYLPALCAFLANAPGYDPHEWTLPLPPRLPQFHITEQEFSWISQSTRLADFVYSDLRVEPLVSIDPTQKTPDQLVFLLETPQEEPLYLVIAWPFPLALRHLSPVPEIPRTHTLVFSILDAILLLHALHDKGILPGALSLLEKTTAHTDTP